MADRGMIFGAPMVRAMLEGRKTQTRRLMKLAPDGEGWRCERGAVGLRWISARENYPCLTPIRRADRIWVREYFAQPFRATPNNPGCIYRADGPEYLSISQQAHQWDADAPWRFARHMPKVASRLTLTVTDVRVQRVQEISEADAIAEGIEFELETKSGRFYRNYAGAGLPPMMAYGSYRSLWNSLHTKPGERWEDDPWVVAVSFTVQHGNIDRSAQPFSASESITTERGR